MSRDFSRAQTMDIVRRCDKMIILIILYNRHNFLSFRGPSVGFGKKKRSVIEQDSKAKEDLLTNLDSQKKNRLMFLQA